LYLTDSKNKLLSVADSDNYKDIALSNPWRNFLLNSAVQM